jgi:DNA-binding MarR family transcriptional regulator
VDKAFAEWQPNPRHRRAKLLSPTPRAYEAIRKIAALQHPWSSKVGDAVGEQELRHASEVIQHLLAAVQTAANAGE